MDKRKYIIELPNDEYLISWWTYTGTEDGKQHIDFHEVVKTPYDLDTVHKEVYDECMNEAEDLAYKLYSPKINEAYQQGLKDAWDVAKKISIMDSPTRDEIFGEVITTKIFEQYSASECIEKIRQYEQEKEEPKKEQSVTAEDVMRQYLDTFCKRHFCSTCPLHTSEFTCGRGYHFMTKNPIFNEEVRRAYAKVLQHEEVG